MKKNALIVKQCIAIVVIFSFIGCTVNPAIEAHQTPEEENLTQDESEPEFTITEIINFDETITEYVAAKSTDDEGKTEFTTEDYSSLEKNIQIEITNVDGEVIEGLEISSFVVGGNLAFLMHDPNGIYGDTIVHVDTRDYSISSEGSRVILIIGVAIVIVKIVAAVSLAYASWNLGMELGEYITEMHDFHVDNFQDISWKTLTYKATIWEIINLLVDTLDLGLSVISCVSAVSTAGTTTIFTTGTALSVAIDQVSGIAFSSVLIDYLKSQLEYNNNLINSEIDESTECIIKINFLPTNALPGFYNAIEITPILSDDYNQLSTDELLGQWKGNYVTNGTYVGCALLDITKAVDKDTVSCVLWDLEPEPPASATFNLDISGFNFEGTSNILNSHGIAYLFLELQGSKTGNTMTLLIDGYDTDDDYQGRAVFTPSKIEYF